MNGWFHRHSGGEQWEVSHAYPRGHLVLRHQHVSATPVAENSLAMRILRGNFPARWNLGEGRLCRPQGWAFHFLTEYAARS
jgi:hypothetical protein